MQLDMADKLRESGDWSVIPIINDPDHRISSLVTRIYKRIIHKHDGDDDDDDGDDGDGDDGDNDGDGDSSCKNGNKCEKGWH